MGVHGGTHLAPNGMVKAHLTGYWVNYLDFPMVLGMVNPLRIDDVWDPDAVAYNPRLSRIISRRKFWEIHQYARRLLARCNEQ